MQEIQYLLSYSPLGNIAFALLEIEHYFVFNVQQKQSIICRIIFRYNIINVVMLMGNDSTIFK